MLLVQSLNKTSHKNRVLHIFHLCLSQMLPMTTEFRKEGEALPDDRVAELTERLERAVALLRECVGFRDAPLGPHTLSARVAAFLAAHQEPKP